MRDIHRSARRHGIADADMLHAAGHVLAADELGAEPERWLVIGPDRAANLLELVVLVDDAGAELIIHAMPLRAANRRLLRS